VPAGFQEIGSPGREGRATPEFTRYLRVLIYKAARDCGYKALPPILFEDWRKFTPPPLLALLSGAKTEDNWIQLHLSSEYLDATSLCNRHWNQGEENLEGIDGPESFFDLLVENPRKSPGHPWQNKTMRNARALFNAYTDLSDLTKDFASLVALPWTPELSLFIRRFAQAKTTPILPDAPEQGRTKRGKRSGPRGPRKSSTVRRSAIKLLKSEGFIIRKACKKLKEMRVPLPSKRNQDIYGKYGWVEWFDQDRKAFYKQWSADLKRGV